MLKFGMINAQRFEKNISDVLRIKDIQKLEEGIYVFGSGNINSILEDYE